MKYGPFVGMLLLALYTISYCKGKEDKRLPVLQNIAAFFVAFACSIQPFFEYPDCISFELQILPFFVYWIQYPYAFKKNEKSCNTRDFMIHILFGMLSMHALVADTAASAIILGVAGCTVFFIASHLKNKRYTRMSAILLVLLGIYASRDFLYSLGWWFYLLIAGIGFFLYAIIREKKR